MSERYYAILGGFLAVPLSKISEAEFKRLTGDEKWRSINAVPVYFCPGLGVWPEPADGVIVVKDLGSMG